MALTDLKVRNAKPTDKPRKLFDSNGLFLYIPKAYKSGKPVKKSWRFKYRFNKVEKLISIGGYPDLSLSDARVKRDEFRALILEGINPSEARKLRKNPEGKSFKEVAIEWIEFKSIPDTKRCWKPSHSKAVLKSLEREVFPVIGDKVITTITSKDIDSIIDLIVRRGALEVAERALSRTNAVFR